MTMQELLTAQGLTEEQVQNITEEMKKQKIFTAGEENLDIRYSKLKTDHENLVAQHGESTKLIEQFKAEAKNNESLTAKIAGYETQIGQLQQQLQDTQINSAAKLALLSASCTDVDYALFKLLKEEGPLELDDQGLIKDVDNKIAGLKTKSPTIFGSSSNQKQVDVHRLPNREQDDSGMTRAELLRKPYAERAALAAENPEAYNTIMHK